MTAQARLQDGYYNSAAFSGANPGGLANGGHVQNFPAALQDIGAVAQDVGVKSAAASQSASSASGSATSAANSAQAAATSAGNAATDRAAAQAAAQAAASVAKVDRAGDTMTGALLGPELRLKGVGTGDAGSWAGHTSTYYGDNQYGHSFRGWRGGFEVSLAELDYLGRLFVNGGLAFHSGNDGSGSGLDADLLRGLPPTVSTIGDTILTRDGNGNGRVFNLFLGIPGGTAGNITFLSGVVLSEHATGLQISNGLYLASGLSASVVTERSDRRLKTEIERLAADRGRLRPVRYVLKATGEHRLGFIAQEVAETLPEAVRSDEATEMLEVSSMALIAALAAQLNDALDRIEVLERGAR